MGARCLWVGTYARRGGEGLYPLVVGEGSELEVGTPTQHISNASFALVHPRLPMAWFVNEQEDGRVVAATSSEAGWEILSDVPSGGSLPCFLARHPWRELLAVANYGDGMVALLPTDPSTGVLSPPTTRVVQPGRSHDSERQNGPHAHCVVFSPDGEWLYHVDLGLDRVLRYAVKGTELAQAKIVFEAPAGWGARHLAFLPDQRHALLMCEMAARCLLLRLDGGRFTLCGCVSTAPDGERHNLGGDLRVVAADAALVTNRGHDSVALLRIAGDQLVRGGVRFSGGTSPRHVLVLGEQMLVAHEEAGGVVLLPLPGAVGTFMKSAPIRGAAFILEQQEQPCAQR